MPEFRVGDTVRVEMPRGYNKRGVLGVSVMFATSQEAKFDGAVGKVTEIDPTGSHNRHLYLVDFKGFDNRSVGIPWQAQWFREEWIGAVEPAQAAPAKTGS
jgi:hypothetical protein